LRVTVKQQATLQEQDLPHHQKDQLLVSTKEEELLLEVFILELLPLLHHQTILFVLQATLVVLEL